MPHYEADDVAATFRSPFPPSVHSTAFRRKRNRLPADVYKGNQAYLVTCVTAERIPRFKDDEVVAFCRAELESAAAVEQFAILAYVFMPDHLHLLVAGSSTSNLSRFMKRFKQVTAFWFKSRTGETLWQKSFHDHVARREEDLNKIALYVAANPVRLGLVSEWWAYAHWGGVLLQGALDGDLKVAATSVEPQAAMHV